HHGVPHSVPTRRSSDLALFLEPLLSRVHQAFEDALTGLVMGHQVDEGVAFGGGVFGVAPDVEVEAGTVLQEDIGGSTPGDDPPEEVTGNFVGTQSALTAQGAGNPVFVLQPKDPTFHM